MKLLKTTPWSKLRAATLQKCGSEIFVRFSLQKVSWNLSWNFGEISVLRFPGFGCATENFTSKTVLGWPRSTVEKGPQSNESYERENPWNRTISTALWVHKKLPQSTVKLVLPSNESYESKTGCNRTLATVLWVPLRCEKQKISRKFHSAGAQSSSFWNFKWPFTTGPCYGN